MPSPRGVCRFRGPAFSARGPESIGWTGALLTGFLLVVPTLGIAGAAYARPAQVMGAPSPGSTSHPLPPGPPPLLNGTTVLDSAAVENDPSSATWDPANGYLYVTNFGAILLGGNTVSVVNGATDTSLATLPVGDDPISSVYDPADGYVYVMNYGTTDNVSVLSGTSVIGAIAVGSNPSGGIYDPSDGNVYVWNTKSANISVINGTSVVATINVGIDPASGAYDASRGYVYVANAASNNVSILQGNAVLATVNVGIQPESTVYDSATQCIYIVNTGS
ncbi:MAG TPA: YncE family protein, partial [Thermoplasmata archaeon]|nr:YncE family protein [Thermoplasmata archaeon]